MKECFKCNTKQPVSEFYRHSGNTDGLLGKCKTCTKKDSTRNRNDNIEKVRAYDRARGNRQTNNYLAEYRKRYPIKNKARYAINNRVKSGSIAKPSICSECGTAGRVCGHHDDYAKPLDVRWLCQVCHSQWHARNGEGKNGSM